VRVLASGEPGRGERVDGSRAAEGDEPARGHGEHVRKGGCREGLGRQAADDEHRGRLQRVLQRVGDDDGQRAAQQDPELLQDELHLARPGVVEVIVDEAVLQRRLAAAVTAREQPAVLVRLVVGLGPGAAPAPVPI
jgi:hypothetical protein